VHLKEDFHQHETVESRQQCDGTGSENLEVHETFTKSENSRGPLSAYIGPTERADRLETLATSALEECPKPRPRKGLIGLPIREANVSG
jgi:hypothetical protein